MKESLRQVAQTLYPQAKVAVDCFHVIVDSNRQMDETQWIEHDITHKRKGLIPKKVFCWARRRLGNYSGKTAGNKQPGF